MTFSLFFKLHILHTLWFIRWITFKTWLLQWEKQKRHHLYSSTDFSLWVWSLHPRSELVFISVWLQLLLISTHPIVTRVSQTLTRSLEFNWMWMCHLKWMDVSLCLSADTPHRQTPDRAHVSQTLNGSQGSCPLLKKAHTSFNAKTLCSHQKTSGRKQMAHLYYISPGTTAVWHIFNTTTIKCVHRPSASSLLSQNTCAFGKNIFCLSPTHSAFTSKPLQCQGTLINLIASHKHWSDER